MYEVTKLGSHRVPAKIIRQGVVSSGLLHRTVPGQLGEVCLPGLTHVDDDVDGYGTNGMSGAISGIAVVIHPIDRDRSHRFLLFPSSFNRQAHASSDYSYGNPARQPSESASVRNASRCLSDSRTGVCPMVQSIDRCLAKCAGSPKPIQSWGRHRPAASVNT